MRMSPYTRAVPEEEKGTLTLLEIDRESEEDLVLRIKEDDNDHQAKELLFKSYGSILNSLAYRYMSPLLPYGDAYQVAALGMLKALRRFDPGKHAAFKSFAYPYIEGELKRFYRDQAEMVRLPRRLQRLKREVILFEEHYTKSTGKEPGVIQVAEHLGEDEEDVIEALTASRYLGPVSLDWACSADEEKHSLAYTLGSVDASFEEVELRIMLSDAINSLPPRLRRIAEMRLRKGWTQKKIADELGISQMHVSRLQNTAMKKLAELCFAEEVPA